MKLLICLIRPDIYFFHTCDGPAFPRSACGHNGIIPSFAGSYLRPSGFVGTWVRHPSNSPISWVSIMARKSRKQKEVHVFFNPKLKWRRLQPASDRSLHDGRTPVEGRQKSQKDPKKHRQGACRKPPQIVCIRTYISCCLHVTTSGIDIKFYDCERMAGRLVFVCMLISQSGQSSRTKEPVVW